MLFLASYSNKYKYRPSSKMGVKWHDLGWPRKRPKLNLQHLRKISNSEIGYYFNYHQVLLHKFIYFPQKVGSGLKKTAMFFNFFVFSAAIITVIVFIVRSRSLSFFFVSLFRNILPHILSGFYSWFLMRRLCQPYIH